MSTYHHHHHQHHHHHHHYHHYCVRCRCPPHHPRYHHNHLSPSPSTTTPVLLCQHDTPTYLLVKFIPNIYTCKYPGVEMQAHNLLENIYTFRIVYTLHHSRIKNILRWMIPLTAAAVHWAPTCWDANCNIQGSCRMATLNPCERALVKDVTGNWHRQCPPGAALLRSERPNRASRRSRAASLRGHCSAGRCLHIRLPRYYSDVPACCTRSKYASSKRASPFLRWTGRCPPARNAPN